jgi:hypothetical protein
MFPSSPGTINCRIPDASSMSDAYYVGRCTSKVWPHGSGTEVSFIESATKLVEPPLSRPTGPKGPTGATDPVVPTVSAVAETGHLTFLVDHQNRAHVVESSDWFPQTAI